MKTFLITLSSFLLFFSSYGQGELQFNQTFTETIIPGSSSGEIKIELNAFTVPSGKVWKIENVTDRRIASSDTNGSLFPANDGSCTYIFFKESGSQTWATLNYYQNNTNPIWLSSGTYDLSARCSATNSNFNTVIMLNGLEFNIIP